MDFIFELGRISIGGLISSIFDPTSLMIWMVIGLVLFHHTRVSILEESLYGQVFHSPGYLTTTGLLYGLVVGMMASFFLLVLGVDLERSGVQLLFLVSLVIGALSPRYLGFEYAGVIVGLATVVSPAFPVDLSQMIVLIGVLRLIEALLMWMDGDRAMTPVFVRLSNKKVAGAFLLQRFWPVPILLLAPSAGLVNSPDWWPLLGGATANHTVSLDQLVAPAAVALGFSSLAVSSEPTSITIRSSGRVALHGLVLLILGILSTRYAPSSFHWFLKLGGLLLAPLGSEWIFWREQREERQGTPRYSQPSNGVRILDTRVGSPAKKVGIRRGDILTAINWEPVRTFTQVGEALTAAEEGGRTWVAIEWMSSEQTHSQANLPLTDGQMGMILVPDGGVPLIRPERTDYWFTRWWDKRRGTEV